MVRFHYWARFWYLDPKNTILKGNTKPGNFVGIAWNTGDEICYKIVTETRVCAKPS